jgi:hypothetical protein
MKLKVAPGSEGFLAKRLMPVKAKAGKFSLEPDEV